MVKSNKMDDNRFMTRKTEKGTDEKASLVKGVTSPASAGLARWKICMVMIVAFLLPGCLFSRPDYPDNWPPQGTISENIEEKVEGTYNCTGEMFGYDGPSGALVSSFLFRGQGATKDMVCKTFSIVRKKPGVIYITAQNKGQTVAEKALEINKDYSIDGRWMQLEEGDGGFRSGDNIAGFGAEHAALTTNERRDLVIKSQGWAAAIVLLIPIGVSFREWVMFERVEPPSPKEEPGTTVSDNGKPVAKDPAVGDAAGMNPQ